MNEEIGRLKQELEASKKTRSITKQKDLKEKIDQVYNVLDKTKNKEIDTETLEIVLNTQQLVRDIRQQEEN